jgi:transposase
VPEIRRKYDADFKAGAVRIVNETRKPIAQVAKDLGINEGTLGNWVNLARAAAEKDSGGRLPESERAELVRLRRENAELAMERDQSSSDPWSAG